MNSMYDAIEHKRLYQELSRDAFVNIDTDEHQTRISTLLNIKDVADALIEIEMSLRDADL